VTPESKRGSSGHDDQKAKNPRRVGSLETDKLSSRACETLKWSQFGRVSVRNGNHLRGGPVKAGTAQREGKPWRGKDPGELRGRVSV